MFISPCKAGMRFVSSDGTVSSLECSRQKKHTIRKKHILGYANTDYFNCNPKYTSFEKF